MDVQYETMFSISVEELKELFEEGYLVLRRPLPVKHVNKHLILLRHLKQNKQIKILADDANVVTLAVDRFNYQMEPTGTIIRAQCIALHPHQQIHLEQIVSSLDGYSGWQIRLVDKNDSFEVISRIRSTEQQDIENEIEKIRLLTDALCLISKVGFFIRHISLASRPRMHPAVSFGEEEKMLQPVEKEDIINAEAQIHSSNEISIILRGLNQAYVDNCYPSRVDRLWATVEAVFCDTPEHLLSNKEIQAIINCVKGMPIAKDGKRLKKLTETLNNPDRLPKEGRNERIAQKISKLLNRGYEATYKEIQKCSRLRGQYGHDVPNNWQSINEAENYLRQVLIEYLGLLTSMGDVNKQPKS
jgi:hypothetical protein